MKLLILCTGNSCRSQMAEGFLKAFDSNLIVFSAGTQPSNEIHTNAILVMDELGVDISKNNPKHVGEFLNQKFDFVITVCDAAKTSCPIFTGKVKKRLHIGFEDPATAKGSPLEIMEVFRRVRNEILKDFFTFYQLEINKTT